MSIEQNATNILKMLSSESEDREVSGQKIAEKTQLSPTEINDAISILEESNYVETIKWIGTGPYHFGGVKITARGKYEIERQRPKEKARMKEIQNYSSAVISKPPIPVGSPFRFADLDWEVVAEAKDKSDKLFVVLGLQFKSKNYDSEELKANVSKMFQEAVTAYNSNPKNIKVELEFKALSAGYGEHLFNEIARDIISADIAVFETSDLNPNVMLEIGVALTWGARVLPIRNENCPTPPSDISGQTWATYKDKTSAKNFINGDHQKKMEKMVERAARKKAK